MKKIKARKEHSCFGCGRKILVGVFYYTEVFYDYKGMLRKYHFCSEVCIDEKEKEMREFYINKQEE